MLFPPFKTTVPPTLRDPVVLGLQFPQFPASATLVGNSRNCSSNAIPERLFLEQIKDDDLACIYD